MSQPPPTREFPHRWIARSDSGAVLLRKPGAEAIQEQAPRLVKKILPILRRHTSHDFSRHKQSTLIRRLQRRMHLRYLDSVSDYITLLRDSQQEVDALFKDLLIGVTQFFLAILWTPSLIQRFLRLCCPAE